MMTTPTKPKSDAKSVIFSCASQRDHYKVTVNLQSLESFIPTIRSANIGTRLVIDVIDPATRKSPVGVIFTVNRFGATAATNGWPARFELPHVSQPVAFKVTSVTEL